MTQIKLLLISLFIVSCTSSKKSEKKNPSAASAFSIERVDEEAFVLAKKKYKGKLLEDTLNVKKIDGRFRLPLTLNNAYSNFEDSTKADEDENKKEYKYLGQFKEIDFYLVSVNYWEHNKVLLVDRATGDKYPIWSIPSLSPNNKRLASILSSGLEGNPIGIQVLSVNKSEYLQIDKLIEIDQRIWNPLDVAWENDSSLILRITPLIDYSKQTEVNINQDFSYIRLRIE